MNKFYQSGQSLLELVVSIGLIVAVLTALTVATLNGLNNSQFAQNQSLATKFAQEGIDSVKNIKDKNCVVKMGSGYYYWYPDDLFPENYSSIWAQTFNNNFNLFINGNPPSDPNTCLISDANPDSLQGGNFKRYISLSNGSNIIKVNVRVVWTDSSGTHESNLVANLTQ